MKASGECRIAASRENVWQALDDPDMLEACIPGCVQLDRTGTHVFEARLNTAVGPLRAAFDAKLTRSRIEPPESYTLGVEGKADGAVVGKGSADIRLSEEESGTLVSYEADIDLDGELDQVESKAVAKATRKTLDEFFGHLSRQLDPTTLRFEIEEEEGHEVANIAMLISRTFRAVAIVGVLLIVLLIVWLLPNGTGVV